MVVVSASILVAVALSLVEIRTTPKDPLEEQTLQPSPVVPPTPIRDPEDFSTTRRISKEEVLPYYHTLEKQAGEYTTVQTRAKLELPQYVEGEIIEAEVRFDAIRGQRWARQIFASRPENKIDPQAKWEVLPRSGTLATQDLFREIQHDNRTAYDIPLDATEEVFQSFLSKKEEDRDKQFANPYLDLLHKIPLEDRLREIVQTEEVKTSQGPEIRVLMRVNSEMSQEIKRGKLRVYFPLCPDCAKAVSLRQDVFDVKTMELKQSIYMKPDRTPFLVHRYLEVTWDEEIPEDRFDLPLPEGGRIVDILEDQRKKMEKYSAQGGQWKYEDPDALDIRRLLEEADK